MISAITVPQSGWHVTKLGAVVIALAKAINGLRNLKFKESTRWAFSWEEGGAIIEYVPTAGTGAAAVPPLWSPYSIPWTGPGPAPADQGRKIGIRLGTVWDGVKIWEPANRNLIITVPANCTDGYRVALRATVAPDATLSALEYVHGTDWPAAVAPVTDSPTGTPPTNAYCALFVVTSTATAVELPALAQLRTAPLLCLPTIVNQGTTSTERRMVFAEDVGEQ